MEVKSLGRVHSTVPSTGKRLPLLPSLILIPLPFSLNQIRMAPDEKQTVKSDVYSYGLVMWEALTGQYPYNDYKLSQLIIKVHTEGDRPPIPGDTHATYSDLMQRAWSQDPEGRPLFPEILKTLDTLLASLQ